MLNAIYPDRLYSKQIPACVIVKSDEGVTIFHPALASTGFHHVVRRRTVDMSGLFICQIFSYIGHAQDRFHQGLGITKIDFRDVCH